MNSDARPHEAWGTFRFITEEAGFEGLDSDTMNYESLYIAAAQRHPNIQFAEYDAAQDSVQKRFLALSGQQDVDLLDALTANQADIQLRQTIFAVSLPAANPIPCLADLGLYFCRRRHQHPRLGCCASEQ